MRSMRTLIPALCCLTPLSLLGAVQGTITNATTGQVQGGITVNLVQPGQNGMQALGVTKTSSDGFFSFDVTPAPGGPALVQAIYNGVTYTQPIPPGTPTTGIKVNVFESTAEPPPELETQHLILLEPGAETLEVSETFFTINDSKLTYQDARNGTLRFYLPEGVSADGLQATVNSTGVNVQRPVEKTQTAGVYKVDYPMRPGQTRYDLHFSIPATATFSGKVLTNNPPVRLVTPGTVLLSGNGVRDMGQEPSTGARIYEFDGNSYEVTIQGIGSLRSNTASQEETGAPVCCEEVPAQIQSQMPWVLGLALGILALGGALLYRKGSAARA